MIQMATTTPPSTSPTLGSTVLGYPRIGRDRELKRAVEAYWAGRCDEAALERVSRDIRLDALRTMRDKGLGSVPVNTFSWYDHVLDTSVLLGAVPQRYLGPSVRRVDADTYFAMARGTPDIAPLEMTKWFDSNYHYLVPEIGPQTPFRLDPTKVLSELAEAQAEGVDARPVVLGPWTYLALAKPTEDAPSGFRPLDRLGDLLLVHAELLGLLHEAGAAWVQLDEPASVRDLDEREAQELRLAYDVLSRTTRRPALLVTTSFADPVEGLAALAATDVDAIGLDLVRGPAAAHVAQVPGVADKMLVLGAVDGRNVWRTDLRRTLSTLRDWDGIGRGRSVATSSSLLHVPYDVSRETGMPADLRALLAFADQKVDEVVALQRALDGALPDHAFQASDAAQEHRTGVPGLVGPAVAERVSSVRPEDRQRSDRAARYEVQRERLGLPPLPTTTIGSFPQTPRVRQTRAAHRAGTIDAETYAERMRVEIREVVDLQEQLGLDVLVHGEPERNDMVQYFAEQLDGYASTVHGWVQSYGSRCVRPPVLYGDVRRLAPMTVGWTTYAQSLTSKPVKGMLTGPVTMLAWSFVRDDQPRATTADQVALALRDEVADLEAAGIAVIQVDEPALRETLPLRRADQEEYLRWSVESFRLATSGVRPDTQVHTHLCYSEFGEVVGAIDDLDADVTSVEAARSRMELLDDVRAHGFDGAIGPGVYDIHSPRVPSQDEVGKLLRRALGSVPADRLWVNPDCGLKTRRPDEVEAALRSLVAAAWQARLELEPPVG